MDTSTHKDHEAVVIGLPNAIHGGKKLSFWSQNNPEAVKAFRTLMRQLLEKEPYDGWGGFHQADSDTYQMFEFWQVSRVGDDTLMALAEHVAGQLAPYFKGEARPIEII